MKSDLLAKRQKVRNLQNKVRRASEGSGGGVGGRKKNPRSLLLRHTIKSIYYPKNLCSKLAGCDPLDVKKRLRFTKIRQVQNHEVKQPQEAHMVTTATRMEGPQDQNTTLSL